MMKTLKLLLAAIVLWSVADAFAQPVQAPSKPSKTFLIDGYFFYEIPVSSSCIVKMYRLKTPAGTSAIGLELAGALPEAALQFAVPEEQIPESESIHACFDEAKAAGKGLPITFLNEPLLKAGEPFPRFSATDIDGRTWTNADVAGKVMVLNLWFTGCGPCCAEMPELSRWKEEMPDVLFFASTYESAERVRPVLEKHRFNWIQLVGDRQFAQAYIGRNGYPLTIVIDKKGIVARVEYGTSPVQRLELKQTIRSLR